MLESKQEVTKVGSFVKNGKIDQVYPISLMHSTLGKKFQQMTF